MVTVLFVSRQVSSKLTKHIEFMYLVNHDSSKNYDFSPTTILLC